jgi:lysophospholipase L1-like esterase
MSKNTTVSGTVSWSGHSILGWVATPGKGKVVKPEYEASYDVNMHGMNDRPIEESIGISKTRIMALGDSHTFAVGVSQNESWPNVLEQILFKGDIAAGSVYNCAVPGYSLGQYLLRMRQMKPLIKPHIVLIGFTIASDLYDLIPPRKGGFVFGANRGRVYFDLDEKGDLIEVRDLAGKEIAPSGKIPLIMKIKKALGRSAFYSRLKRSKLAMWVIMNVRPKGKSVWAGPDTALAIKLDDEYRYRWQLAEALIKKISMEAHEDGMRVVLINIPYIPQVYDDVWASSYGRFPKEYDRWIVGDRLKELCVRAGIYYVDVTRRFVDEVRKNKRWLHYPLDGHPTVGGHRVMAETVAEFLKKNKLVDY